jgi:hypothetical protein
MSQKKLVRSVGGRGEPGKALGLMALALEGLAEARAGRSIPHAEVLARLDKEYGSSKPQGRPRVGDSKGTRRR